MAWNGCIENNTKGFFSLSSGEEKLVELEAINIHLQYVLRIGIYATYKVQEPPD